MFLCLPTLTLILWEIGIILRDFIDFWIQIIFLWSLVDLWKMLLFFPAFRVSVLLIEHFYILNTREIKMIRRFNVSNIIVTAHPHVVTRANLLKEALSSWWQIHFDWLIFSRKLMWRNKNLRSLFHRPDLINDKMLEINVMKDKLAYEI